MTTFAARFAGLALALALILTASTRTTVDEAQWITWLHEDAGTSDQVAACVADRAFATFPPEVLAAGPRSGFSALPGGWRERLSAVYIACSVRNP